MVEIIKNKILSLYRKVQNKASWNALKTTCHLLKVNNGITEACGTGVLLKVNSLHFLVTAAHVADNLNQEIHVGINESTVLRLGGNILTNNITGTREADRLDLCVVKLCEESILKLSKLYSFLDISEIELNHDFKEFPMYEFVGFPYTKSKYNKYKKRLKSVPYHYITIPCKAKAYEELKCNPKINVVLNYERKKVFNFRKKTHQIGPELYGISGCGLWYVPSQNNPSIEPIKKLVAIINEWPVNNRKYLVGTRIDLFTEIIRQKFDPNIEKSRYININFQS